ncbi:MAG: hypothetical protein ACRD37_13630, partial [Candidatus Acidiferrales bacterium]
MAFRQAWALGFSLFLLWRRSRTATHFSPGIALMESSAPHEHSGLLTDLYELTMAAGYFQSRFDARATFELFVRNLPPERNFLVAAGLEQALQFIENIRFAPAEVEYLQRQP